MSSPQTPFTSATPYASPQDFLNRYDVRTVGQLLNDSDTSPALTQAQVLASAKLNALLMEASGDLEAAVIRGQRYTPTDLATIVSNAGVAKEWVVGLICAITAGKLCDRRFDRQEPPPPAKRADEILELLGQGQRIIPTQESAAAGFQIPQLAPPLPSGPCLVIEVARRYLGPLERTSFRPGGFSG